MAGQHRWFVIAICLAARMPVSVCASPAPATHRPLALAGDVRLVAAPIDFTAVFDNDRMLLLPEKRDIRLPARLPTSFATTGRIEKKTDQVRGELPSGLVVNSYFFATTTGGVSRYRGSVNFSGERVVAVVTYPELTATQPLFAFDGTVYDFMGGIDLAPAGGPDVITISPDRHRLEFDFIDLGLHDAFRVLTVNEGEPAAPAPP